MTNQFAQSDPYRGFADVSPLTGSEWVAEQLPGVTLLKAFNAMFASYMAADPRHGEGNQAVFVAGDDEKRPRRPSPGQSAAWVSRPSISVRFVRAVRSCS
ncbi:NAD(P)-binding domain-containing protein [Fodinicola feengrottensis]|uniref:hypothetical protein n=1 Tax=Fodinicola feengrottensis TaxID=435914 RepID=UPI0024418994|nr:hypothetical protein [Fodinicola feengrottensis]